jgi:hypothetical protein
LFDAVEDSAKNADLIGDMPFMPIIDFDRVAGMSPAIVLFSMTPVEK